MRVLSGKCRIVSIVFLLIILFISFLIFNKTTQKAIRENVGNQLYSINKQNTELAKTKIEKILNKLQIFTENLIDSGTINNYEENNEELIKLIRYFRSENSVPITGIILDNDSIFINENNERIYFDKKVIYDILSNNKSIFKYSIDEKDYVIATNKAENDNGESITTVNIYGNNFVNNELLIPLYTEIGDSFVVDKLGSFIIYSSMNQSEMETGNLIDSILSYSEDNLEEINKFKLDMSNNESGIIEYEKDGGIRVMSYLPIGVEDLYLCTIILQEVISYSIYEFKSLNRISTIIIIVDICLLFVFFTFLEVGKEKNRNKKLNLDIVTNGNSYKKFQEQFEIIHNKKNIKAIYMEMDLDNFKIVNTVLGRECGDEVLKKIYEILQFHIGSKGCYCRKAGDEFLAYYEYKNDEDIEYIVNSICNSIRHISLPKSHILKPSVGICCVKKDVSIENLEMNALIAKKKSKNKINEFYSYFKDYNLDEMVDNKKILDDMNKAILDKEFRLVYQPKFDAKTKKVVGAEALIRWTKPDNTTIFPNEFIPIAEKTGFITFIDSYVFKEVCEKQAEWSKKGYNIVPISINISREKLKDENFLYEYLKIVADVGIEKEYVQLEVTEGDTYSYDNVKTNIVDLIKDAGFKVLIDDFGVGYSSLTMLKDIKADVLKLDKSFIDDQSFEGKVMIKNIINIAKVFNYKIVAEGVETEEQYDFLKEDCDEIQGYYFSKPLEEDEFIDTYLKNL